MQDAHVNGYRDLERTLRGLRQVAQEFEARRPALASLGHDLRALVDQLEELLQDAPDSLPPLEQDLLVRGQEGLDRIGGEIADLAHQDLPDHEVVAKFGELERRRDGALRNVLEVLRRESPPT